MRIFQHVYWALLLAFFLLAGKVAADPPLGRPNFVVILCDDLGYGDLACFGHPVIETPHLDQLAAEGMRFTSCYSAAPVCSPSRCGLLTGRTPSRIGIYDWIPQGHAMHLPTEERTVATLLQEAGYATCHVGKWHCNGKFNSPDQPQPDDHGFDHWFSTQNNAGPSHHNPQNFVRNGRKVGPLEGYSCNLVAAEAIRWLREQRKDQSFFLCVCFHESHEPVASPSELVQQYSEGRSTEQAEYFANVTNMDRAVGQLLEELDRLELSNNTLVFFTSDNGPETLKRYPNGSRSYGSPGPLRGMKLHLYEGGIRVPGIMRFPARIAAGQTSDVAVSSLDLLPTFCQLAGVALPNDRILDGTDITPLLDGQSFNRSKPLYWHYFRSIGEPKAALRVNDWMILGKWNGPQLGPGGSLQPGDMEAIKDSQLIDFELYNLKDDPAQTKDLAATEPEKLKDFAQMLRDRYHEVQQEGRSW